MREPREGYGYGVIRLHQRLAEQLAPILRIEITDTQGHLQEQGIFDDLRQILLLPDDYTVQGVFFAPLYREWHLYVEAPGVPDVENGAMLPELTLWYERQESGENVLRRVEISGKKEQANG